MNRKLRYGMIGGGRGAFIGAVHRIAARLRICVMTRKEAMHRPHRAGPDRHGDDGVAGAPHQRGRALRGRRGQRLTSFASAIAIASCASSAL